MKKILITLCDFLEKKLYNELTWEEMSKSMDITNYRLFEAQEENKRLRYLLNRIR